MTTKVSNTVSHKTSQGTHLVTKGGLVIIHTKIPPSWIGDFCYHGNNGYVIITKEIFENKKHWEFAQKNYTIAKPFIISYDEKILDGDLFLGKWSKGVFKCSVDMEPMDGDRKIFARPQNFSKKQLQAIVEGKLKRGDDVYVECLMHKVSDVFFQIKYCSEDTVTIYRIDNDEKKYSLSDFKNYLEHYKKQVDAKSVVNGAIASMDEYFNTNQPA